MYWKNACSHSELKEKARVLFREGPQQVFVFWSNDAAYAIDNRCPHEGYPLIQGEINSEKCTLTCNWHNWKFDLHTGEAKIGQDSVRTYETEIRGEHVWVNLLPLPPEVILSKGKKAMQTALEKRQYGRMTREIGRLLLEGLDPLVFLTQAIQWSSARLEYGTGHAYAVAADWVDIYKKSDSTEDQIIALTECLDYIALESLRHQEYVYPETVKEFSQLDFLTAIENEDESEALAVLRGAFEADLPLTDLELAFSKAAFAHFNDFGHSLIYTQKSFELIKALGEDVKSPLLLALTRSLIYATREDLLPEFKGYANSLAKIQRGKEEQMADILELKGSGVNKALTWTLKQSAFLSPQALYQSLFLANTELLSRYDESYQSHIERPVADNAGWLNLTHALTFAHAVRVQASQFPELWDAGNVQLALFYGRNAKYTHTETPDLPVIEDVALFWDDVQAKLLDHGIGMPIFAAHLVKTAWAIKAEVKHLPLAHQTFALQTLARFLKADLKQKHLRRTTKQSLALLKRDY